MSTEKHQPRAGQRWRITGVVLATVILLSAVFLWWGYSACQRDLDLLLAEHRARIRDQLALLVRLDYGGYGEKVEEMLLVRPELATALARRDRESLARMVRPLHVRLLHRQDALCRSLAFCLPDNSVLFSFHDRSRPAPGPARLLEAARLAGRRLAGFVAGPSGVFYQVVQPVIRQGRYLGAVVAGLAVEPLLNRVAAQENLAVGVLLEPAPPAKPERTRRRFGGRELLSPRDSLFDRLPGDLDLASLQGPVRAGERWYLVDGSIQLASVAGAPAGRLVFAVDVTNHFRNLQRFLLWGVLLAFGAGAAAYLALFRGMRSADQEVLKLNRSLAASSAELAEKYEELARYRQQLENVVVERTVDLARANADLSRQLEAKEAIEQELRRSRTSLAKAQEVARLGHWEWYLQENRLSYSEEALRIFGATGETPTYTYQGVERFVHPADRAGLRQVVDRVVAGEEDAFQVDFRIIRPDGSLRYIHSEAELSRDGNGQPWQLFGTVQDVSQEREASQELHLAASVFASSIEGIVITDQQGIIQKVNRAFTEITGFSEEEVVGRNPRLLKSDRHDQAFFRGMWQTLLEQGRWQGEIWNRRKNGEVYPQWLTITAIRDERGRTSHYVGVFHDTTELKLHEEQLRYQAHHDALTKLPNRVLFRDRLGVAMGHARRRQSKLAVLFLDLDNFKRINDSLGHTIGDLLLKEVAERLQTCLRGDDTVARYGGDEFIVLLEGVEHEEDVVLTAQRIIQGLEPPFLLHDYELYLTASIGIAFYPEDGKDQETLIRNADTAMYRAKDEGRNTYQVFTPAMSERISEWLSFENSLRKALERDQFRLFYQPKLDLVSGRIVGAEALIRWQREPDQLISPGEFIPMAEDTGLVVAIGEWVVERACWDARDWYDSGSPLKVSVNLSPRQFRQDNLAEMVESVLHRTGLPTRLLGFEITEGTVMDNEKKALFVLNSLKELGFELSIDDFGTGYSSLYYLKRLPLDELKIDRRFIRDILRHEDDYVITSAIISMAKSLRLRVVAEGVETVEQLAVLREQGCDQMQGYLFSRPVPVEEFTRMLTNQERLNFPETVTNGQFFLPFSS